MRWLHLSDVHERDAEKHHRVAMYDQIVAHVKDRVDGLDLVFFTGDLAFGGSKKEYDLLQERLIYPLRTVLPDGCPIYTVPGNHDVDRKRSSKPRVWITDPDDRKLFQDVGPNGRMKRADTLMPRFDGYRKIEECISAWGSDWLDSDSGSICKVITIRDHQIALVGINTAWLCQDDEDSGRLTPGRYMVESALDEAAKTDADLIIVLGHHPLTSLMAEGDWADQDRVRGRLEQINAIYLHGHLHASGGRRSGDSMQSVLAIQAPSGFQAADSQTWRNGIMWGEIDFGGGQLIIEPKLWNEEHREYVFESDAAQERLRVPGRDAFSFPLPGWKPKTAEEPDNGSVGGIEQPGVMVAAGWEVVDQAILAAKTSTTPSLEEMSDWFDGSFPRWEVAVADGVQPRQLVDELVRRLTAAHHGAPQPIVELLTGAGGEGKSAALLQTAAGLIRGDQNWSCLWRSSASAELPASFIDMLPYKNDHAWIVAIDDAENIADVLPNMLKALQPRTDVHLVLASREADWSLSGQKNIMWQGVAAFSRRNLMGLDAEDALRIANGWKAYGADAMGLMRDMSVQEAAQTLLKHSQGLSASGDEGALLGALLMAREGEDLRERVNRLMTPWQDAPGVGDKSLLDIYAMIAAMHAENQLYLSRTVLAYALGCSEDDLDRGPLRVLRREAMVDGGTGYVLTRHRMIAEVACSCLTEIEYDVDRWFPFLARAAYAEFRIRRSGNPDIGRWVNELAQHFIEGGVQKRKLAQNVAKVLFEYQPDDPIRLNNYASTLRRSDEPGAAIALFRAKGEKFNGRRDVLYEWSVSAGQTKDYGLDIWLAARSIADNVGSNPSGKQCSLALAGLGAAFRSLEDSTGRRDFTVAQAACGRLGLSLPDLDHTGRGYFEAYASADIRPANAQPTIDGDLAILKAAIVDGSYEVDPENDPPFYESLLGEPEGYGFTALRKLLSGTK